MEPTQSAGSQKSSAYSLIVKSLKRCCKNTKKIRNSTNMNQKILGIDLGTSSLGLALRDLNNGTDLFQQLEYFSSIIFQSGIGTGKSGEFSFASERRKYRSQRRLHQARRYRIWATLELLIEHGCCPLTIEGLDHWRKYVKNSEKKREYPINNTRFEQWVRLDFDGDGKPEYSSPYQLRAELVSRSLDWDIQTDRYKFGRAMYHIAQRRGFKSSKGETLSSASENEDLTSIDISTAMKKSEEKKSKDIKLFMETNNLKTVGCAFALLEKNGTRIRNSQYQAVQSLYITEVNEICKFQKIDTIDPQLYSKLISTKKGDGTIFYRRPLQSQKRLVGRCTLETSKHRCPISHPDFEEFRALSFINNIKFRLDSTEPWRTFSSDERHKLFSDCFTRSKSTFKFEDIRKWIEKEYPGHSFSYIGHTINFQDDTTVPGCPIIHRLKKILDNDWHSQKISTEKKRTVYRTRKTHIIEYNYEDLWHLAYTSDDYEQLAEQAETVMKLSPKKVAEVTCLWSSIQEGYTTLSLKAIRNILPFLKEGTIYSKAVILAKIPEIIGTIRWNENRTTIIKEIEIISNTNAYKRCVFGIANTLIANYYSRSENEKYHFKFSEHKLDSNDKNNIIKCTIDTISEKKWNGLSQADQTKLISDVGELYQRFFSSPKKDYYKTPRLIDVIKDAMTNMFPDIANDSWNKLYHPSQISIFPHQKPIITNDGNCVMEVFQLGSPDLGSIKNPVVLRSLHVLRNSINQLLLKGMINEDTRIVVETARDMNDANWRKAIERYQREREKENEAIITIIKEFRPNYSQTDIEKGRLLFEQIENGYSYNKPSITINTSYIEKEQAMRFAIDMQKYKLWKEQKFRCIYTGNIISLSDLFADNIVDIEHTIPRSISFDNSLKNRTVCNAHYNRTIKGNHIPTELADYNNIKDRIKPWEDKVRHIKSQIELWKGNAKSAPTIERKNECLQQKHMWELELDYWQSKVRTFTIEKDELALGFRNSQLVDTRIITKYAFHYLKTVFSHVDVQKGRITADFRKIIGIQSSSEKKDRSKHSHHAIDAAILTAIPSAARRDHMIELYYQLSETSESEKKNSIKKALNDEIQSCHIGNVSNLVNNIEQKILVNHISKDQTLTPSKRQFRIHNKRYWKQGDSIRGSLHQESFYGAISDQQDNLRLVIRKPLKDLTEKDLNTIVDPALQKAIISQVHQVMTEQNVTFAKAIETPIYMTNKKGEPTKYDKHGNPISPIRHIRCFAKAGRGELKYDTVLKIKQQTYTSKQNYKNVYYAQNDDNYLCLLYEGTIKGSVQRAFRLINYFDIAQLRIHDPNTLFLEPEFATLKKKDNKKPEVIHDYKTMPLRAIIKKGTRVLLYKNHPEEAKDYDNEKMNSHLYIVYKFNIMGTPNIYLRHHLEARKEKECDNPNSYLSLKADNFKALIEHVDFQIDQLGNIYFN